VSDAPQRYRFAPSPTGYLHLGSARTALFNWLAARHSGGELLLRIEDTDAERSQAELVEQILRTLEWLGLDFDGEPLYQSTRRERYLAAADALHDAGLAYWCDLTAEDIRRRSEERGGKPGYDGYSRDRGLGPGEGRALRFRVPDDGSTVIDDLVRGEVSFENADLEDFVIVRSTGDPMFLLANSVDDADTAVTHVVRGEDLLSASPKTALLRTALAGCGAIDAGLADEPLTYAHLPLIVNEKRQKLSKRRDDVALEDYRDRGIVAEAMRNYLATLGWGTSDEVEIRPIEEIIALFRLEDVKPGGAFFDVKKLEAFNGEHLRMLTPEAFAEAARPWVTGPVGSVPGPPWRPEDFDDAVYAGIAPEVQTRVRTLADVPGMIDFLFFPEDDWAERISDDDTSWRKDVAKDPATSAAVLDATIAGLEALPAGSWAAEAINAVVVAWAEANDVKMRKAQAPVRVAVTGRSVGPPLWESIELLGPERTLTRLRVARAQLP
jgi:glutamyl-tRNA synthetase